jgi:hypothetical protein
VSNGCFVCGGLGRVLAFGACHDPIPVPCPECAGLSVKPASVDDVRAYTAAEITVMLLARPALPPASEPVELVDESAEASV